MEKGRRRGKILDWLYEIGIWFKGIDGVLELIGGILLLAVSQAALNHWITGLTQYELSDDPGDWVASHLRKALHHFSMATKIFASGYLLGHGAIKVFLVWGGLLRRKLWSFPTAMILLCAFIGYQSYRVIHRFSLGLLTLTLLDVFVALLIWREYRILKAHPGSQR